MEMTLIPILICALGKGAGRVRNQRINRDPPNYSFVKIRQYLENSPGDLRRLFVSQTSAKSPQYTLALKTRKED